MLTVFRDLLKYDGRFRVAFVFLLFIVAMAVIAMVSPFDPKKTFVVPIDRAPSLEYPFGTTSRGQDLFWWMAYAVRNSLILGIVCALVSRIIAIAIGLTAGYRGGMIDRALMSFNDGFVVMPVLPVLILLSFLLRGKVSLLSLGIVLGLFGWPWDARLIRAQVLSLKERSFTRTAVYSGSNPVMITLREHLPLCCPSSSPPPSTICCGPSVWKSPSACSVFRTCRFPPSAPRSTGRTNIRRWWRGSGGGWRRRSW
ncbi:MAG: ABC transporter permease [Caldilineaceae bacterium]